MTFTIEQLEALKEGTTPGPWGVDDSDPDWPILTGPLVLEGNLVSQEILADLGGELSDPNFHMILATPAVIDQLIAAEKELQQLKEMMEVEHAFATVTRLTVVGGSRRILETWGITNVVMSLQDDGRTLKIFYGEGNND